MCWSTAPIKKTKRLYLAREVWPNNTSLPRDKVVLWDNKYGINNNKIEEAHPLEITAIDK